MVFNCILNDTSLTKDDRKIVFCQALLTIIYPFNTSLLITIFWISLVPSPIVQSLASR